MELWEFTNPNFHRDRPDLLSKVQRKRATKEGENAEGGPSKPEEVVKNGALMRGEQGENGAQAGTMQLANVWSAIQAIKRAQSNIHTDLQHLQTSNQHLWQEAIESRRRSKKQQETINKMLRFLAGVFGTAEVNDRGTHAPNGHPSGGRRVAVRPRKKDRLMIADASMEETPDDTEGEIEELELPLDEEEEIEELPTHGRFSEARSASEQSPRASSPFGSNPRFTHVGSPSTGTHALPNLPSETTSTPGGSRRISQQTSNQILNALASSEGNAWLASIFGGGAANAGSSRPTTPGGGLRLDAQTVAALQSAMASGSGSGSGGGSRAGPSSSSGNAGGLNGSADYFSAEDEMEEPRFAYPYPPFGASSNANGDNMGSTAASSSSPSSGAVPAPAANSAATSWPGVQTTSGTSAAPNMAPSDAVRFAQQHRTGPASAFSQALVHSPSPARPGAAGVSSSSAPSFSTGAGAPGPSGMGLMLAPNASGQPSTSAGNSASAAHAQAQNQMLSALSLARATQDLSSTSNDAGMVQNSINMLIESLKLDPNALGLLNQAGLGLGQGQQGHHGQPGQQGQQGAQAPATGSGMGMGMGMGMALPTTPRGQSQNRLNGIHDSTFGGVNNSGGQGTSAFGGANTGSGSGSGIGAGLGTATASGFSDAQQHSQPSQGFAADFDMDSFLSQFGESFVCFFVL